MFICGSGSFGKEDDDHEIMKNSNSPCSTPNKRSKRSTSFCKLIGKDNSNKNPYADRGLDKFYALLAELDDKKQKIYTQMGNEDISFVRFVYTNDDKNVKPIVVKVKEKSKQENNTSPPTNFPKSSVQTTTAVATITADANNNGNTRQSIEAPAISQEEKNGSKILKKSLTRCKGSLKLQNLRQPYYYFPVIVVLILLFLAIYGKSFAILCTSIGWYLIPTINGRTSSSSSSSSSNTRRPKRKHSQKEYVKKLSEKKIVHSQDGPTSPKSVINGLTRS